MPKYKDLTGQVFGRLTVIKRIENKVYNNNRSKVQWLCMCNCDEGNFAKVTADSLLSGGTTSCGCLRDELKRSKDNKYVKHGLAHDRLYKILDGMKQRCYNPNHMHYDNYGGRSIIICDEWLNKENGFITFYDWANNNGYSDELSIDRINSDGIYEPDNCRWATPKQQQNNTSYNINVIYHNNAIPVNNIVDMIGISPSALYHRYRNGDRDEKLFRPVEKPVSKKQSGVKGIIWSIKADKWVIKSTKNGKKDTYICSIKELEDAIQFKKEYDSNIINIGG